MDEGGYPSVTHVKVLKRFDKSAFGAGLAAYGGYKDSIMDDEKVSDIDFKPGDLITVKGDLITVNELPEGFTLVELLFGNRQNPSDSGTYVPYRSPLNRRPPLRRI